MNITRNLGLAQQDATINYNCIWKLKQPPKLGADLLVTAGRLGLHKSHLVQESRGCSCNQVASLPVKHGCSYHWISTTSCPMSLVWLALWPSLGDNTFINAECAGQPSSCLAPVMHLAIQSVLVMQRDFSAGT